MPQGRHEVRAWVYGSVFAAGSIAALSATKIDGSLDLAAYVAGVMVSVWLAHGFANVVASESRVDHPAWPSKAWTAAKDELGVLAAGVPTVIGILAVAVAGGSEDAAALVGLITAVLTMVVVAFGAARSAGASQSQAVLTGLVALVLGGLIITAKVIFG